MIRRLVRLALFISLVFVLFATHNPTSADQNAVEARWIHAELNRWRLSLDLGPLAYSSTLEAMAIAQAEYVLSLPRWPDNVHAGRNNEGPRIRARWEPYNWSTYGITDLIIIGEITWLGTREDALDFWHSSTIHRNTATNPRYREVGVAALPSGRGHLFVVVMGARPDVLPALADPHTDTLYLSNETFSGGIGNTWIRAATQIRLFDSDGRPLSNGWIPWQAKIPIPDSVGESLYVLYSDETHQVMDEVSILERDIPLPEYADAWQTATPEAPAQIVPTATPTPPPVPRIRIVYNNRALTLYNIANTSANVAGLEIVAGERTWAVTDFNSGYLRGSFSALPPWNCLHVTLIGQRAGAPPPECRHTSTTTLPQHQLFWTSGDFQVHNRDTLVAECRQQEGVCEFNLQ